MKFLRNHFEGGKETPQTDQREIDELTMEVERLKKRIANLVDMRLDGEISNYRRCDDCGRGVYPVYVE